VKTNSAVLAAIHKLTGRSPKPRINRIRSRTAGFLQPPLPLPAPPASETVQAAAAAAVEVEVEVEVEMEMVVATMPTEPQQLRGAAAKLAEARQRATLAVVKPIQRKAAVRPVVQKARAHTAAAAAAATPKEATAAALRKLPPPPPPTSRLKGKENVNREAAATAYTAPRRSRAPAGATARLVGRGGRRGADGSRGASGGGVVALAKRDGGSGDGRRPGDKRTWQSPVSGSASALRGRGRGAAVAAAAPARPTTTAGRLAAKVAAAAAAARAQGGMSSAAVKKAVAVVEPRRTRQGAAEKRRPQREKAGPRTEWAFKP
jgi:hypothetical protein